MSQGRTDGSHQSKYQLGLRYTVKRRRINSLHVFTLRRSQETKRILQRADLFEADPTSVTYYDMIE